MNHDSSTDSGLFLKNQSQYNLWEICQQMQSAGMHERSVIGRKIAYALSPTVFDTIDFNDDDFFLIPAFFSIGLNKSKSYELVELNEKHDQSIRHIVNKNNEIKGFPKILNSSYPNLDLFLHKVKKADIKEVKAIYSTLRLMKALSINLYNALFFSTKYILPFAESNHNSCAHELFPGVAFINVSEEVTSISLLEDITHQAMHCTFSDIEYSKVFNYESESELLISEYVRGPSSNRSLSVLHHSTLTVTVCIFILYQAIKSNLLNRKEIDEAFARIGFLRRKLEVDLSYLKTIRILNLENEHFYYKLLGLSHDAIYLTEEKLKNYKFCNQPYNFSYSIFIAENT